jgi:hypothetical protein
VIVTGRCCIQLDKGLGDPKVGNCQAPSRRADSVEKVASLKWLQICQITNDIFD